MHLERDQIEQILRGTGGRGYVGIVGLGQMQKKNVF